MCHFDDRAATIGPERVRLTVPPKSVAQGVACNCERWWLCLEFLQVFRNVAGEGFDDDSFGYFPNTL